MDSLPTFLAAPSALKLVTSGSCTLTITNKEARPVTYKIKTTTPARYVVRPRMGAIHPNDSVTVSISHRPSTSDGSTGTLRDRFKVECVFLTPGISTTDDEAISNLWASKPKPKEAEVHCEVTLTAAPAAAGSVPPSASNDNNGTRTVGGDAAAARAVPAGAGSVAGSNASVAPEAAAATRFVGGDASKSSSEAKLREHIQQLEAELRAEKSKMEIALVAGRAKEKEIQMIRASHKKKRAIPLTVAVPMMLLVYLLSWYLHRTRVETVMTAE